MQAERFHKDEAATRPDWVASLSSKSLYWMDGLHFAELVFAFLDGNSCVPW
jgi:hypothetical protein